MRVLLTVDWGVLLKLALLQFLCLQTDSCSRYMQGNDIDALSPSLTISSNPRHYFTLLSKSRAQAQPSVSSLSPPSSFGLVFLVLRLPSTWSSSAK